MKRTAAALSLIVSLALLPGCGGDSDKADTSDSTAAPAANAESFARAKGKVVYNKTCVTCHGVGGVGVENLGKNWVISEFIKNSTDAELLAFIRAGRTLEDPMSAGNAIMPPSGGDPTLSDEDLNNVILYMRSLQK